LPRATVPLASLLLLAALPGCGDSVDVAYRREAGVARNYVRSFDTEGTNPSGVAGRVRQEVSTTETALEVVRGDYATVEVKLDRIVAEVFRGGAAEPVLRMDTASPEPRGDPPAEPATEEEKFAYFLAPMRWLAGARVEVDVKESGKVLRVRGADEIRKGISGHYPEGDARRNVADKMPWEFWCANLMVPGVLVAARGMSAGKDLKFLDIRTLPETTGTGGIMYYAGTFRVAKVEAGVARLEMEGKVTLDPPSPDMPPWPAALASRRHLLRLNAGTCRAWAKIRVETGLLEEDEHVTDLDLHFVKPDGTGEVPIPTKVTQKSKLVK
jgi:hypothetical protein